MLGRVFRLRGLRVLGFPGFRIQGFRVLRGSRV